ncbi:hypothetical protein [Agrobacterium sp. NPDC089420]|uniref:hypothetical protein n=1 Tax=Agrobacterium sp. NPDC089420 TaxID=3363918 RepID=UPI00384DD4F8
MSAMPAQAVTCVVEGSKFTFQTEGYGPIFGHGTQAGADRAYDLLQKELGDLAGFAKPTIFYVKAGRQIVSGECAGEKCAAEEMQAGWKRCSEGAKTTDDICLPLAVVYQNKLYCLLQPPPPFEEGKPFVPYTPPFNR